jgi:hypothetical protein
MPPRGRRRQQGGHRPGERRLRDRLGEWSPPSPGGRRGHRRPGPSGGRRGPLVRRHAPRPAAARPACRTAAHFRRRTQMRTVHVARRPFSAHRGVRPHAHGTTPTTVPAIRDARRSAVPSHSQHTPKYGAPRSAVVGHLALIAGRGVPAHSCRSRARETLHPRRGRCAGSLADTTGPLSARLRLVARSCMRPFVRRGTNGPASKTVAQPAAAPAALGAFRRPLGPVGT